MYLAVATTFIADCWSPGVLHGALPDFAMLFVGIMLFVPLGMIYIGLPFKLLDAMFRLMFVCALMPLWVILWVLPITQGYAKKAFDMFLNVMVTFICLSVIMLMVLVLLGQWFSGLEDLDAFRDELQNGYTSEAFKMMNFSTSSFFIALAMSFLACSLVNKTEEFVNNFVGGGVGGGMGAMMEGRVMGFGQKAVGAVAAPLASKAAKSLGGSVGKIADGVKTAVKKTPYAAGFVVGAAKQGLHNLNSDAGRRAFTPTGMIPSGSSAGSGGAGGSGSGGTGSSGGPGGKTPPLKKVKSIQRESLPDGKTKETEKTTFTDKDGKKKMEHTRSKIRDRNGNVVSTSVTRETFGADGKSTGSMTVTKDQVTGAKQMVQKDSAGKEIRKIIKETDGTVTTQNNYTYDVDGKLDYFEKKVEDKLKNVIEYVRVDAKTRAKTDLSKP